MIFGNTIILLIFLITTSEARTLISEGRESVYRERIFDRSFPKKFETDIVNWIGEAREDSTSHETNHDVLFFRMDGKKYNIIDSPDLVRFCHEKNKNYLLEIEAEKTPSFLFWGGNLIVKKFKIVTDSIEEAKNLQKSLI